MQNIKLRVLKVEALFAFLILSLMDWSICSMSPIIEGENWVGKKYAHTNRQILSLMHSNFLQFLTVTSCPIIHSTFFNTLHLTKVAIKNRLLFLIIDFLTLPNKKVHLGNYYSRCIWLLDALFYYLAEFRNHFWKYLDILVL